MNFVYSLLRKNNWPASRAKSGAEAYEFVKKKGLRFVWAQEDMSVRDACPDDTDRQIDHLMRKLDRFELYHECLLLKSKGGEIKEAIGSIFHDGYRSNTLQYEAEMALDFIQAETSRLGVNPIDYVKVAEQYHGITKG